MKRGGAPDHEIEHGRLLVEAGAVRIWGWDGPAGRERVRARVRWMTQVCHLGPGKTVLECGCGAGVFTRELVASGATITAVDISGDLLDEAARQCDAPNVTFARCNLEQPDELPDEAFDAVLGVSVLHHLDLPRALPALWRKLKPGGQAAFSEPNLLNPINRFIVFTDDQQKRRKLGVSPTEMAFYPAELREAFEGAGFRVRSLRHRDFMHPRVPGLLVPCVKALQLVLERTPVLRRWSGSLMLFTAAIFHPLQWCL